MLPTRHYAPLLALTALCASFAGPLSPGALAHGAAAPTAVGDTYKPVRGLGTVKRASERLLRVKLRDATTVVTHGLDPEPAAPERAVNASGPERQPACATDHYQHVLYGYPSGATNRLASVKATIVGEMRRMDALLNEEALASGGRTADYKVLCDGAGQVRIDSFQSSETDQQTSFGGLVSAARQAGFNESNAEYTIFFDSSAPPACGTGTISSDQRLTADNANNSGGGYAVVYSDCWTDLTAMHENGHNQGAVQYDAPYSTGSGAHCDDGYDVMCYSDGGDKDVGLSVFCPDKEHFDCRHDTYFDVAPDPGQYLATHWNLGSPLNRFIALDDQGPRTATCADGVDNDGDGRTDYPADLGCSSATDTDETDLPACLDLSDNDRDGKTDWPADPGCASPLDNDESDPARSVDRTSPEPTLPTLQDRQLPTLTMATARRYARQRIRSKTPRATRIKATCSRRTRTSATCRVGWKAGRRAGYKGSMVVRYRYHGSQPALVATSRVRKYV
ncbi:MAG: hypothetical protein ABR549_02730 [Mycobacteriales bacterium]